MKKKIIGVLRPFDLVQKFYVYEETFNYSVYSHAGYKQFL